MARAFVGAGSFVFGSKPASTISAFHSGPCGRICGPWISRAARCASSWQSTSSSRARGASFSDGARRMRRRSGLAAAEASGQSVRPLDRRLVHEFGCTPNLEPAMDGGDRFTRQSSIGGHYVKPSMCVCRRALVRGPRCCPSFLAQGLPWLRRLSGRLLEVRERCEDIVEGCLFWRWV